MPDTFEFDDSVENKQKKLLIWDKPTDGQMGIAIEGGSQIVTTDLITLRRFAEALLTKINFVEKSKR